MSLRHFDNIENIMERADLGDLSDILKYLILEIHYIKENMPRKRRQRKTRHNVFSSLMYSTATRMHQRAFMAIETLGDSEEDLLYIKRNEPMSIIGRLWSEHNRIISLTGDQIEDQYDFDKHLELERNIQSKLLPEDTIQNSTLTKQELSKRLTKILGRKRSRRTQQKPKEEPETKEPEEISTDAPSEEDFSDI